MIRNFTKEKKEYLRIASRFLKEVGLYDLWIKYCYDPDQSKNWIKKEKIGITDILRCTNFTYYVIRHKPRIDVNGYRIFEIFGEYVLKMHPEYEYMVSDKSYDMLTIDTERKKITWN
jgi:hypothetical protein